MATLALRKLDDEDFSIRSGLSDEQVIPGDVSVGEWFLRKFGDNFPATVIISILADGKRFDQEFWVELLGISVPRQDEYKNEVKENDVLFDDPFKKLCLLMISLQQKEEAMLAESKEPNRLVDFAKSKLMPRLAFVSNGRGKNLR